MRERERERRKSWKSTKPRGGALWTTWNDKASDHFRVRSFWSQPLSLELMQWQGWLIISFIVLFVKTWWWLAFVGPCPHRDRDYCIASNFWKFYLIITGSILREPVSLVKVFRQFRLERVFLVFRVLTQYVDVQHLIYCQGQHVCDALFFRAIEGCQFFACSFLKLTSLFKIFKTLNWRSFYTENTKKLTIGGFF
jgi:hypothetical protein